MFPKKTVATLTLGCKVNQYETDAVQQLLQEAGYEIVEFQEGADIYLVNTCSVTNMADKKSRQMLHRAKKMNIQSVVIAMGCYVQSAADELMKDPYVDLVIGNNKKKEIVSILSEYFKNYEKHQEVIEIDEVDEYEEMGIHQVSEHTRAYIKVQDGCNQFCSYCIIPFTRGRIRSRKLEDIIQEVEKLAENGYQEFVLTGIHLSSYGKDFEEKEQLLLSLVQAVAKIKGVSRVRLGSLEPRIITEEFVRTLVQIEEFCPHFHLSLQSGCDSTLKRMNRHYSCEEYKNSCDLIRSVFDRPAITTDIIVGFPGETEEEFEETRRYLEELSLYEMHIFKFSRRKGTKADRMLEQIPEKDKTKRSQILLEMTKKQKEIYENQFIGMEVEVLLEEEYSENNFSYFVGHTKRYQKIAVRGEDLQSNRMVKVIVEDRLPSGILVGNCIL